MLTVSDDLIQLSKNTENSVDRFMMSDKYTEHPTCAELISMHMVTLTCHNRRIIFNHYNNSSEGLANIQVTCDREWSYKIMCGSAVLDHVNSQSASGGPWMTSNNRVIPFVRDQVLELVFDIDPHVDVEVVYDIVKVSQSLSECVFYDMYPAIVNSAVEREYVSDGNEMAHLKLAPAPTYALYVKAADKVKGMRLHICDEYVHELTELEDNMWVAKFQDEESLLKSTINFGSIEVGRVFLEVDLDHWIADSSEYVVGLDIMTRHLSVIARSDMMMSLKY